MSGLDTAIAETVRDAVRAELAEIVGPRRTALTVPEVAWSLGTSQDTVRRLIDEGHLALVPHVGRRQLVPVSALEEFVLAGASTSSGGRTAVLSGGVDGPSGSTARDLTVVGGPGSPSPAGAEGPASTAGGSDQPPAA